MDRELDSLVHLIAAKLEEIQAAAKRDEAKRALEVERLNNSPEEAIKLTVPRLEPLAQIVFESRQLLLVCTSTENGPIGKLYARARVQDEWFEVDEVLTSFNVSFDIEEDELPELTLKFKAF